MSDQARIETAIDTTIDNCEVLRARLAKYEDADGKPITTIAEQAREIERRDDRIAELIAQCNEIYAIKAKPSGMVLPERQMYTAYLSGVVPSNAVEVSSYRDGWNACLDEVARLNQLASSGDERSAELCMGCVEQSSRIRELEHKMDYYQARAALSANHSEQVRDGWQLVPVTLTPVMYASCHLASSVACRVWRDLLAAAPSAGSQKEQG